MKKKHILINTLLNLKDNQRILVYTEPMWGIPYNLFYPYATLYMYAFGVHDAQIGFITTLGLILQFISAYFSGIITDKFGRRKTLFIFDFISWCFPTLVWAIAQNTTYFIIAAMLNATWRVSNTAWSCLLIEDNDQESLIEVYSWIHISGLIAAFFAPITGFFISKNGLIYTMRFLYMFSFVVMTAKNFTVHKFVKETSFGIKRKEEVQDISVTELISQYGDVIKHIFSSEKTIISLCIMGIMSIFTTVNGTFWSLKVTETLNVPNEMISIFVFLRSAIMLVLFFVLVPRIDATNFRFPMFIGLIVAALSQFILISAPAGNYLFLILNIITESFALALINPLRDTQVAMSVDPKDRARITAMLNVIVIALTSPFGWIAGVINETNRNIPFIFNIVLLLVGALLVYISTPSLYNNAKNI